MAAPNGFETNIHKLIAASAYSLVSLSVAREMFGKGYFALGVQERSVVDQQALQLVAANFQAITPQLFATQMPSGPMGFQPPKPPQVQNPSTPPQDQK